MTLRSTCSTVSADTSSGGGGFLTDIQKPVESALGVAAVSHECMASNVGRESHAHYIGNLGTSVAHACNRVNKRKRCLHQSAITWV